MRVSASLHWVFAGIAVLMIRGLRVSPVTAWIVFILFLVVNGLVMFLRFRGGRWAQARLMPSLLVDGPSER